MEEQIQLGRDNTIQVNVKDVLPVAQGWSGAPTLGKRSETKLNPEWGCGLVCRKNRGHNLVEVGGTIGTVDPT